MSCDVSILIVNWNTRDLVLACLDSLPASVDDGLQVEVVVVDNGSGDGSAAALAARPDITLIANPENLGFAAAVNQAYRRASGEFIMLLNSDVELHNGALSTLVRFLREHPKLAGAAPLYVNPDGSPQPFHFRFPTFVTLLVNGSAVTRRLYPGSKRLMDEYRMIGDDFSEPRPVEQPSASCLLLRSSMLPANELLDERYPIFFHDVKLALTLAGRGFELWVVPEAVVSHEAHSSGRMVGRTGLRRLYVASVVQLLSEIESPGKVWLYRVVVFVQNSVLSALRRPGSLHGVGLWKALGGDPGPLPRQPKRQP